MPDGERRTAAEQAPDRPSVPQVWARCGRGGRGRRRSAGGEARPNRGPGRGGRRRIILTRFPLKSARREPIREVGNCARHTFTMSGIQISGLLSNSAFDWKAVVDQLIAIDTAPITKLGVTQGTNRDKVTALDTLKTTMVDLQDSLQSMRVDEVFASRTVASNTTGSTWKSSSVTGAAIGNYTVGVEKLATAAKLKGAANVSSGLAPSSDVTGVTLATMRTATAVTAGTITVDNHQVTVALTDSLQDVFDKVAAAAPDVTASYDSVSDKITFARSSGELVLGAANDTSNLVSALKLANNATGSTSSSAALGTLKLSATLANAGMASPITAVDGAGNGTFAINGVAINYNVNTDTLGKVLSRINAAGAGVIAAYDSASDRVVVTNKLTGDTGVAATEDSGGLLDALGLTAAAGGTLVHGQNAQFRINGGALLSSASNTLDSSVHGVDGLSITVNSETTQTLQVESDTATMSSSIQSFIDKFNAVQDFVDTNTKITVSGSNVSTTVLSDNREIQEWARKLQRTAFEDVSGASGSVKRLDNLGIDFNATTGKLAVKNSGKLATALSDHPEDVQELFLKTDTGFVPKMFGYLTNIISADSLQQSNLAKTNTELDAQIATLQTRLASQRETLTNAFLHMLDAQSAAQSQNSYLTNSFFKSSSG